MYNKLRFLNDVIIQNMHSVVHCETYKILHVKVPKHEVVDIRHKLHMLDDTLIVRARTILI